MATPCYDGRADVWYMNSLIQTVKLAPQHGVEIVPIWLSYDALIQRARNDCVALALETGSQDCVFIDSDLEWEPEWFFKLLQHDVDVVGGTYRKKTDQEETYVVKLHDNPHTQPDMHTGLIPVQGLGTGFLRLSRKALEALWNHSEPYTEWDQSQTRERRWIFNTLIVNGQLVSEDIWMCKQLTQLGIPIWLDPSMTLSHMGMKKFQGDFQHWLRMAQQPLTSSTVTVSPPSASLSQIQDLYK